VVAVRSRHVSGATCRADCRWHRPEEDGKEKDPKVKGAASEWDRKAAGFFSGIKSEDASPIQSNVKSGFR